MPSACKEKFRQVVFLKSGEIGWFKPRATICGCMSEKIPYLQRGTISSVQERSIPSGSSASIARPL